MRTRTWLTWRSSLFSPSSPVGSHSPVPISIYAGFRASHPIREGLDLQGGLQVVLQARPVAGQTIDSDTLEGTRQTLERRVNGLGVSEPLIQTRGNDQIIVELPGVDDPQEAIGILQQTALLEIIDPLGQYLPPGTVVNTTLGPADDARRAPRRVAPDATPVATPVAATPVAGARTPTARSTRRSSAAPTSRMPTSRPATRV